MIRVYVAGPYTAGDVGENVSQAIAAGEELLRLGFAPYIPHLTHFWHVCHPHTWETWIELDQIWLLQCQAVLRLPGKSKGADLETRIAEHNKIPIFYSMDTLDDYYNSKFEFN